MPRATALVFDQLDEACTGAICAELGRINSLLALSCGAGVATQPTICYVHRQGGAVKLQVRGCLQTASNIYNKMEPS